MQRRSLIRGASWIVLLAASLSSSRGAAILLWSATPSTSPESLNGRVKGSVVSATTGAAVAGAKITFLRDGMEAHSISSTPDRHFEFDAPRAATYSLLSVFEHFLPYAPKSDSNGLAVTLRAGDIIDEVSHRPENQGAAGAAEPHPFGSRRR